MGGVSTDPLTQRFFVKNAPPNFICGKGGSLATKIKQVFRLLRLTRKGYLSGSVCLSRPKEPESFSSPVTERKRSDPPNPLRFI